MSEIHRMDPLVERYVKLRDLKAKIKAEYDDKIGKLDEAMEKIEGDLMSFLNQTGLETANSKHGTFFKRTTTSAKVADRDTFLHFVIGHDALNFLESRVSKVAVEEYIAEHGTIPPGIDVQRMTAISVNRPKVRS